MTPKRHNAKVQPTTILMTAGPAIIILGYDVFSVGKEFFSEEFKGVVNTISPHSYIIARNDSLFREALMASDFIIPDGVGIVMAASVLEGELAENNIKRNLP